MHKSVFYLKKV